MAGIRKESPPPHERTVVINGHEIPYQIRRHPKAKHLRLKITPFDGVIVTMPLRLPRYINPDKFVLDNGEWVLTKLQEAGHTITTRAKTQLRSGRQILFRGILYRIVVERLAIPGPRVLLHEERKSITVFLPHNDEADVNAVLKAWLREQATEHIRKVLKEEAAVIGVQLKRVAIREQKTKWGSCTSEGNLSFNWRLILFPPRILRYVVIHELCHLRHFDHSIRFWRLVAEHMPDYHSAVEWLRTEGMNARNLLVEL